MAPAGKRQAPRGGEVSGLDVGNHQAHGAGDDRLLNRPERIAQPADLGGQPERRRPVHLAECGLRHTPQIAGYLCLTDPEPGPAPGLPGYGQDEAGDRAAVPIIRLGNLVQAAHAQPIGKRGCNRRRSGCSPHKAVRFECGQIHNVLILFF